MRQILRDFISCQMFKFSLFIRNKLGTIKNFERSAEMTRKFGQILFLSLLAFAFLAGSAFSLDADKLKKNADLETVLKTLDTHPNYLQ